MQIAVECFVEAPPDVAFAAAGSAAPDRAKALLMIIESNLSIVMVGLVPTIHPSACSGARGELDPRDKPEDDSDGVWIAGQSESETP